MHPDQYMIYHLTEWDSEKNKWKKKPVGLDGSALPTEQGIPTSGDRAAVARTVTLLGDRYRLGLWLHPDSQFFFLDLDDNAVQDGRLTPLANSMAEPFIRAGCYFEASTSGRGAHVIGRYRGLLQPFATSRKRVHPHEFFVRDRGVVLNVDAHAGSWDTDATALLPALLTEHFQPRHANDIELREFHDGPSVDWRGPVDDDDLIRKFLAATGSAAARLRGSTSLVDLWNGNCPHTSESDLGLASHLAFWTGCDAARVEHLMRRSPLAAHRIDKWDTHRTYLRELTIREACVTTKNVYEEAVRVDTAAALLGVSRPPLRPLLPPPNTVTTGEIVTDPIATDWFAATEQSVTKINSAGTLRELFEDVIPVIRDMQFPGVHRQTIIGSIIKKCDSMGSKQLIANIRDLIAPRVDQGALAMSQPVPEWAQTLVYVLRTDRFFDTSTGADYSTQGLRMRFAREMPMKNSGTREDPVQRLMEIWNVTNVDDVEYHPGEQPVFEHAGRTIANRFRASTMPTPVFGSAECAECVRLFQQHLLHITNQRFDVYSALLGWIAHNVQFPGRKIRWAPLIKGVGGDGKSIIGELMFAAMGEANVKITSPSNISNSGGFTDWAMGACVNLIEEINLEGKERRKLYNVMKAILGDGRINPNLKGKASTETYVNVMNHAAFTNYDDATPVENGDRRWCVIFTPWVSIDGAVAAKGLASTDELVAHFKRLAASFKSEPGAWRSWLMGIDLSSFNPDGRAPVTDERDTMITSSEDFVGQTIRDCIERGGTGITSEIFCSWSLMQFVQREMGERPDVRSWNRILTDLGYRQLKPLWWSAKTRRVWVKFPMTKEQAVEKLNQSALGSPISKEL